MQRPNFGSEQPNSLPKFKLKFYKRQIYSFAFLGSEFFCPQPKCKCVVNDESFVNLFVFVVDSIIQLLLTIILGVGAGSLHFATCNSHALVVILLVGSRCPCEGS